jgi:hypothetical protein
MRLYVIGTKEVVSDKDLEICREDIYKLDYNKPNVDEFSRYEFSSASPF